MMIDLIENQLAVWPEANARYAALGKTERRTFRLGDLHGAVQHNPARAVSTGAPTDKASIAARPCFLCRENRPEVQTATELPGGWELLVNPYPIFPVHFTIASKEHRPQGAPPMEMVETADRMPELAIFLNGARSGASAPDHAHMQAVYSTELPLLRLTERFHPHGDQPLMSSAQSGLDLPFHYWSAIITPDAEGARLLRLLFPGDRERYRIPADPATPDPAVTIDPALLNTIVWKDTDGFMRTILIPRKAHRPACWPEKMVSPGTIDMAGIIITPRQEDFLNLTEEDIRTIYSEVAYR